MLLPKSLDPITGAALGMSYSNDLDVKRAFAEDNSVREPMEKSTASAVQIQRANLRGFAQVGKGCLEFVRKIRSRHWAAAPIPITNPRFCRIQLWIQDDT
jgi:hypothetical protein